MRESAIANVVLFMLGLAAVYIAWRMTVTTMRDYLRATLFELRREMFMYMAHGHVSAEAALYGDVRRLMNNGIRFAECFHLGSFILHILFTPPAVTQIRRTELQRKVDQVSPDVAQKLLRYREQATNALTLYLFVSSPIGWLLLALAALVALLAEVSRRFRRVKRDVKERIPSQIEVDVDALREGEEVLCAA